MKSQIYPAPLDRPRSPDQQRIIEELLALITALPDLLSAARLAPAAARA